MRPRGPEAANSSTVLSQSAGNRPARLIMDTGCERVSVTLGRDLTLYLSQSDPELMLRGILRAALA